MKKVGDPVLVGNGSKAQITLAVYTTQMGVGNRLESIKLLDLIEYKAPEPVEEKSSRDLDDEIPF